MSPAADTLFTLDANTRTPMLDRSSIQRIQSLLRSLAPRWSAKMRLVLDEGRVERMDADDPDALGEAIVRTASPRRFDDPGQGLAGMWSLGTAIGGGTDEFEVFLNFTRGHAHEREHHDVARETGLWRVGRSWAFCNHIGLQIFSKTVEGESAAVWARRFMVTLLGTLTFDHAFACARGEFELHNLDRAGGGLRAVGRDISRYLPGLYWLNYFGDVYCRLMDRERIRTAPAFAVDDLGSGILLQLSAAPAEWATPAYQARRESVLDHLGQRFFFSREHPEQPAEAPDFGIPTALPPASPPIQLWIHNKEH